MAVNQKEIERSFCALVVEASTVWATKPDAAPTTRFLASVLVSGAGAYAFRATEFEQALSADFSVGALDGITVDHSGFNHDIHASAEYRGHLVSVMAKRAVEQITG